MKKKAEPVLMSAEDAEEYTQALGQIVAGGWRQIALGRRLGVPEALGISTPEWVEQRLGGYVKLSLDERRQAAKELIAPPEEGGQGLSTREAAEVLGVSNFTVSTDVRNLTHTNIEAAQSEDGAVSNLTCEECGKPWEPSTVGGSTICTDCAGRRDAETPKEKAARETKTRREVSRSASVLPDAMDLRIGDARAVMESVPDRSLALVLTDPPYGDEAEPLYEWLVEWAARKLIPGGSLICYTGQSRLNRDIAIFDRRLRYWWLLTMKHDKSQRLPGKFVVAESKPVLWYVNEYRRGRTLITDTLSSERDLSAHPWAQGSGGVALLIENLTDPGEMIGDPFAGTGRWGEIACQMGRRWVGADIVAGGAALVEAS